MTNEGLEHALWSITIQPITRVSTIGSTQANHLFGIKPRILFQGRTDAINRVDATNLPILGNIPAELVSEARGAVKIGCQYGKSHRCVVLQIPAIVPIVAGRSLRSPMIDDCQGVFLRRFASSVYPLLLLDAQSSGTDEPRLYVLVLGALVNDLSGPAKGSFCNRTRIEVRQLSLGCTLVFGILSGGRRDEQLRGHCQRLHSCEKRTLSIVGINFSMQRQR
mmetsp:Transcript_31169/g.75345  ORF Transcript_31169/g.75345 Transcript_31169/m.75345 type:complete len:221 (-) Transcript_31169:1045-1707(-)